MSRRGGAFASAAAAAGVIIGMLINPFPSPDSATSAKPAGGFAVPVQVEAFCDKIQNANDPRFMTYDAVVPLKSTDFGPPVAGNDATTAIDELEHRVCIDAALLTDLLAYNDYGYSAPIDSAARMNAIQSLKWGSQAWSDAAAGLISTMRTGDPELIVTADELDSWYYNRGGSPDVVPQLGKGDLATPRTVLLAYTNIYGERLYASLICGGQPTRFKQLGEFVLGPELPHT